MLCLFGGAPVLLCGACSSGVCLSQPVILDGGGALLDALFRYCCGPQLLTTCLTEVVPIISPKLYRSKSAARTWQGGGGNFAAVTGWGWDR